MAMAVRNGRARKNGRKSKPVVSELGKVLTWLSNQYAKSGGKLLSCEEIEREVAERRGGSF